MPGSFTFDTTLPPKLDINVGAKSHFFQPPQSPSASSSLHYSSASLSAQVSSDNQSRKRPRHDSFIPTSSHTTSTPCNTSSFQDNFAHIQSPAPFVSTRYELAGGLDTPAVEISSVMDHREGECHASPTIHLRGGRGFRGFDHASDDYFPHSCSALARELNGRPRVPPPPPRIRDGLGRAVHSVVGVAGKVLEFATAFRGFFAGGGRGYAMNLVGRPTSGDQSVWVEADGEEPFMSFNHKKTLVPGQFPEEDYIPDYMSQNHRTPPRAYKKRQRETGEGEISASWVIVEQTPSRESSPSKLCHRKVPSTTASARRRVPKPGRRPILSASRPSLTSKTGPLASHSDRTASFASPRSPLSSPRHESPVNPEMQRRAAKIRKRELEEDAHLKRFNQQLKAMIKEGKEALGTRIEVADETIDDDDPSEVPGEPFYCRGKR